MGWGPACLLHLDLRWRPTFPSCCPDFPDKTAVTGDQQASVRSPCYRPACLLPAGDAGPEAHPLPEPGDHHRPANHCHHSRAQGCGARAQGGLGSSSRLAGGTGMAATAACRPALYARPAAGRQPPTRPLPHPAPPAHPLLRHPPALPACRSRASGCSPATYGGGRQTCRTPGGIATPS